MTDNQDVDPSAGPPPVDLRMFVETVYVAVIEQGQAFSLHDSTDPDPDRYEAREPVFMLRAVGAEGRDDNRSVEATLCWPLSHLIVALGNLIRVAGRFDLDEQLLDGMLRVVTGAGLRDDPGPDPDPDEPAGPDLTVCVWGRQGFVNVQDDRIVTGTVPCDREPSSLLAMTDGTVAGAVCPEHAAVLAEHEVFGSPSLYPNPQLRTPPTTTPGSEAALREGCRCSVTGNNHGRGGTDGTFVISDRCPVHHDGGQP